MNFFLKQRYEFCVNENNVRDILDNSQKVAQNEIEKNFFVKIAGFRVKLYPTKNELIICRSNPFWDYTSMKVTFSNAKALVEIKAIPSPVYYIIFLILAFVYGSMLMFVLNNSYNLLIPLFIILFFIWLINMKIKSYCFYVLDRIMREELRILKAETRDSYLLNGNQLEK